MRQGAWSLENERVSIPGSRLPAPVITFSLIDRLWRLEQPYSCQHSGHRITVPAGFRFDLASIPRPFWWLIAPFELSIAAPLVHDFLYRYRGEPPPGSVAPPRTYTRRQSDIVFRDLMEKERVARWRRLTAYAAVRLLGRFRWGRAPQSPESGEQ